MLEIILNNAYQPISQDDYLLTRAYDGRDTVSLTLSRGDPAAGLLQPRTRVLETTTGQTFLVTGVDGGQSQVDFVLKKDLTDWTEVAYPGYTNGSKAATAAQTITQVMPSNWTLSVEEENDLQAYIALEGPTPLDVVLHCMEVYGCAVEFDNRRHVAHLHFPGQKPLGTAFLAETANLRAAPEYKSAAGDMVTRLYAQGAGGVDFADINEGKSYVECFDSCQEVVAGFWRDDRYTVPQHLLAAAREKIKALSQPERSWSLCVCDLQRVDEAAWPGLELGLYDVVRLVDPTLGQTMEAQITQLRLYPHHPEKNEISITNVTGTLRPTLAASLLERRRGSLYGDLVVTMDQVKKRLMDTDALATTAQNTAETAQTTANTAQSTADTAQNTANTAQSTADTAQNTANAAQSTADTAQNTANTAQSTADTAQNTANTAQSTAQNAAAAALAIASGTYSGGTFLDQNRIYAPDIYGETLSLRNTDTDSGAFPTLALYPAQGEAMVKLLASGNSRQGYSAALTSPQDLVLSSDCAILLTPGAGTGASGEQGVSVDGPLAAQSLTIGTKALGDFVVEQGTSGIWRYRIWASGLKECWGQSSAQRDIDRSWENKHYISAYVVERFPFSFSARPTVTVSACNDSLVTAALSGNTNGQSVYFYLQSAGSVSGTWSYSIYAIGA